MKHNINTSNQNTQTQIKKTSTDWQYLETANLLFINDKKSKILEQFLPKFGFQHNICLVVFKLYCARINYNFVFGQLKIKEIAKNIRLSKTKFYSMNMTSKKKKTIKNLPFHFPQIRFQQRRTDQNQIRLVRYLIIKIIILLNYNIAARIFLKEHLFLLMQQLQEGMCYTRVQKISTVYKIIIYYNAQGHYMHVMTANFQKKTDIQI
eukprot:TRINITY_DN5064_c1_g1_i9.p2 TRINITY_DN5064_c1_g1~~TRINITY_DN5064_c1_g1_i9.p2  ORF type:complete len:207 (+),score=-6.06 TRINITY_DN5064_c1_g1_i9:90-710(+)